MEKMKAALKPKLNRLDIPGSKGMPEMEGITKAEKNDAPVKQPAFDYSGFVIVRLSERLVLNCDACDSLSAVAKISGTGVGILIALFQ